MKWEHVDPALRTVAQQDRFSRAPDDWVIRLDEPSQFVPGSKHKILLATAISAITLVLVSSLLQLRAARKELSTAQTDRGVLQSKVDQLSSDNEQLKQVVASQKLNGLFPEQLTFEGKNRFSFLAAYENTDEAFGDFKMDLKRSNNDFYQGQISVSNGAGSVTCLAQSTLFKSKSGFNISVTKLDVPPLSFVANSANSGSMDGAQDNALVSLYVYAFVNSANLQLNLDHKTSTFSGTNGYIKVSGTFVEKFE